MDNRFKWQQQRGGYMEPPNYGGPPHIPRSTYQVPYKNYKRNHNNYGYNKHPPIGPGGGNIYYKPPPPQQQQQQQQQLPQHARGVDGVGLSQVPLPEPGSSSSGSDVVALIVENNTLKKMIVLHLDLMHTQNESLMEKDKKLEDQNGRIKTLLSQNQELMQQIAKLSQTIEDLRKEFRRHIKRSANEIDEQPKAKYQCCADKHTQTIEFLQQEALQQGYSTHATHSNQTQNVLVTSVTDLPPRTPVVENNKSRNEFNGGKKVRTFFLHRVHQEEEEQQQEEEEQQQEEEKQQEEQIQIDDFHSQLEIVEEEQLEHEEHEEHMEHAHHEQHDELEEHELQDQHEEHELQEQHEEEEEEEQVEEEQVEEEEVEMEMEIDEEQEHVDIETPEAHDMEIGNETIIGAEEELGAEEVTVDDNNYNGHIYEEVIEMGSEIVNNGDIDMGMDVSQQELQEDLLRQLQDTAHAKPHKKVSSIIKNELKYLNCSEDIVNKCFQSKKCDEPTLPVAVTKTTKSLLKVEKNEKKVEQQLKEEKAEEVNAEKEAEREQIKEQQEKKEHDEKEDKCEKKEDTTHISYVKEEIEEKTISVMSQKVRLHSATVKTAANHRITKSHVETTKKERIVKLKNLPVKGPNTAAKTTTQSTASEKEGMSDAILEQDTENMAQQRKKRKQQHEQKHTQKQEGELKLTMELEVIKKKLMQSLDESYPESKSEKQSMENERKTPREGKDQRLPKQLKQKQQQHQPEANQEDQKQPKQLKQKQQHQLEANHQATESQVKSASSADKLKNNQATGTANTPYTKHQEATLGTFTEEDEEAWMNQLNMKRIQPKDPALLQKQKQEAEQKEKLERERKEKLERERKEKLEREQKEKLEREQKENLEREQKLRLEREKLKRKVNDSPIEPQLEKEKPIEQERSKTPRGSKELKQSKQQQQQEEKEDPNIEEETKRKLHEHLQKQQQRLQSQQQPLPLVRLKKSQMQNTSLIYPPIAQTSATITPAPSPTNATSPSLTLSSSSSNNKRAATAGVATVPAPATTSIQTPLTPQSISSVSSGSNSSNTNNNKSTIIKKPRSNSRFLTSLEPYTTRSWEDQEFHCDNEFFLEEADELLADNPSLEIPKWKVIRKHPSDDKHDTEPLSDSEFVRRHEKYVRDEIERKKRDARYIREQMRSEALRVRHNQDEVLVPLEPLPISTFYPLPEDIEAINYVTEVPVQAFGENVVNLQAEPSESEPNFTLPWLEAVHGETAIARLRAEAMPVATLASKKLPTSAAEARHQEMNSSYVFLKRRKRQRRR
ncbi:protein male-specific lethal-1 isoform X2 [Drosophila navojoa]|uniref:protein male-specific lethal-1 isoform X2 n=1 Tax=Drosophila navojoa TaxID=7232 RepID=UPI0011BD9D4C|nr:protein male-specific lethal-1 isoform X2 [Drosophila navojoa]